MKLITLKRRRDFLDAAYSEKADKWATRTVVVQSLPFEESRDGVVYVGFTATKRLGSAVTRNRVRRRLRSAAARLLPLLAKPGRAYVFIGRPATAQCDYQCLLDDLEKALIKLQRQKSPSRKNGRKSGGQKSHRGQGARRAPEA